MNIHNIFVYGTLRRNHSSSMYHLLARYSDFIGDGYVNGKLYEINNYPGIILSKNKNEIVYGEVYKIHNSSLEYVLHTLDEYEECSDSFPEPHEYKRVITDVTLMDGRKMKSWIYEYNLKTDSLEYIKSGNYIDYINNK